MKIFKAIKITWVLFLLSLGLITRNNYIQETFSFVPGKQNFTSDFSPYSNSCETHFPPPGPFLKRVDVWKL